MSGGSFNYLCWKDAAEIMEKALPDLEEMGKTLAELGWAEDAATETEDLLRIMRSFLIRADVRVRALARLWKSVEWMVSCDSGLDHIREELAAYRGDLKDNPR